MALPTNVLQNVQTYNDSNLAYLINHYAFLNKANKKFKDFNKISKNLGDTVTFDLPPRYVTNSGLVATFQDSTQRVQSLTVDQAVNTAYAFSSEQLIFNVEDYMQNFGKSAMVEIGSKVEADLAKVAVQYPYRFYGDGSIGAVNSYGALARALAFFRNYGAAKEDTCGFIDDMVVPEVVNSGLSQFVLDRNNRIANSWELGSFSDCEWYQSNLLPLHTAGQVGQSTATLTVTGVTTDPDGGISAITFSGAPASVADALNEGDLMEFNDGVAPNFDIRYLTFNGHAPSKNPVQIRVTAQAASDGAGNVTANIYPKLYSAVGANQNITRTIAVGMQTSTLPSHRAGVIYSGKAFFLGMPKLPEQPPFDTWTQIDPDSGASLRSTFGSKFGENEIGMVHDVIWGKTLVPEYSMRLVFPA